MIRSGGVGRAWMGVLLLATPVGLGVSSVGCAVPVAALGVGFTAAQAGTTAFTGGHLRSAMAIELEVVREAVLHALDELEYEVTHEIERDRGVRILAKEEYGRTIAIQLSRRSPAVTKLSIKFGAFGDQALSRLVLFHVQTQLANVLPAGPRLNSPMLPPDDEEDGRSPPEAIGPIHTGSEWAG